MNILNELKAKIKKISKSTTHTVSNNQIFELPCPSLVLAVYGFACAVCVCVCVCV